MLLVLCFFVVLGLWVFVDANASIETSRTSPLKIRSRLRGKDKVLVQLEAQALSAFPLTTFAGQQNEGGLSDGVLASEGRVSSPGGIWSDEGGNVYFSDTLAHTIMRVDKDSSMMRVVGGVAGRYGWNGDGSASRQTLFSPTGVSGIKYGDRIIFCDTNNHVIRELSLFEGEAVLTTFAGRGGRYGFSGEEVPATEALLSFPVAVFVGTIGDVFIAELDRCTVRKVTALTGLISTIAGVAESCGFSTGGPAISQLLNGPRSLFVDVLGNVWIVDGGNRLIRRLSSDGVLSIVSNGMTNDQVMGSNLSVTSFDLLSLWVDKSSNVFVSDARGVVSVINATDGSMSWYASLNVSHLDKRLWQPILYPLWGEEDILHQLFVGDSSSNRMMRVILPTETPTVVPSFLPSLVPSADPSAVPSFNPSHLPSALPTFSPSAIPTAPPSITPTQKPTNSPTANPSALPSATPSVKPTPSASPTKNPTTSPTTSPTSAPTLNPSGVPTPFPTRNPTTAPTFVPSITPSTSPTATPTNYPTQAPTLLLATVLVGKMYEGGYDSGLMGVESEISSPWSIWTSSEGDIYFTDTATHTVSQYNQSTGIVTIVGGMAGKFGWNGDGKAATSTRLHAPTGLTGDRSQGKLLICDTNNHVVRSLTYGLGGAVSTVQTIAGQGKQYGFAGENVNPLQAKLSYPIAVYFDFKMTSPYYRNLYIAELGRCTIRVISAATNLMSTIAGIEGRCEPSGGGVALLRTLNQPHSIFGDSDGNLLIADTGNHVLRQYNIATGHLTTIAGTGLVSNTREADVAGTEDDGDMIVNGVSPLRVNFSQPFGVWLDKMNNIFISEGNGTAIRMINSYDKKMYTISNVSKLSDEVAPSVLFQNTGRGIYGEQNEEMNVLFIADALRNVIFRINLPFFPTAIPTTIPTTVPTNPPTTTTPTLIPSVNPSISANPTSLAPSTLPTIPFTVPTLVQRIRATGRVHTVAGGGTLYGANGNNIPATSALFALYEHPSLFKDSSGLYISEDNNGCVRKVVNGIITTLAGICGSKGDSGDNGPATNAKMLLGAINLWSDGTYMYLTGNSRLRKVDLSSGIITAVAGKGTIVPTADGVAESSARIYATRAIWGNSYAVYFSDICSMLSVRETIVRLVLGVFSVDASCVSPIYGPLIFQGVSKVVTHANGTQEDHSLIYYMDDKGLFKYDLGSKTVSPITPVSVDGTYIGMYSFALDSNENIFVIEHQRIGVIDAVTKLYWVLGGFGEDYSNGILVYNAKLYYSRNIFVDTNNDDIYYVERGGNGLVRVITSY